MCYDWRLWSLSYEKKLGFVLILYFTSFGLLSLSWCLSRGVNWYYLPNDKLLSYYYCIAWVGSWIDIIDLIDLYFAYYYPDAGVMSWIIIIGLIEHYLPYHYHDTRLGLEMILFDLFVHYFLLSLSWHVTTWKYTLDEYGI